MLRRSFLVRAAAFAGLSRHARAAAGALGTVAYTHADGLWIRDLPDGKPRLLASGAKIDSPRFSPTGRWLTYFRGEGLYLISVAGGPPRQLGTPAHGPGVPGCQWLPQRDELLVSTGSGLRVFSVTSGWTGATPNALLPVAFSPDVREIVYGDDVTVGRGPGGEPLRTGRLCRVALAQPGQPKVLFSKYLAAQFPVVWTGDWVIFREDPDFSASLAADGLELYRLPASGGSPQSLGISAATDADMLSLSLRGKLAVSAGRGREDWQDRRIAVIDPATAPSVTSPARGLPPSLRHGLPPETGSRIPPRPCPPPAASAAARKPGAFWPAAASGLPMPAEPIRRPSSPASRFTATKSPCGPPMAAAFSSAESICATAKASG